MKKLKIHSKNELVLPSGSHIRKNILCDKFDVEHRLHKELNVDTYAKTVNKGAFKPGFSQYCSHGGLHLTQSRVSELAVSRIRYAG